ncbi:MAG: HdeA/HdeB family chaperone [Methylocystis sp.]
MTRKLILAGVLAAAAIAAPASAQVTVDMSEITCKQFGGYDANTQAFVAEWMAGYFSATKNLVVVDERYVKRNTTKILAYCKKRPKETLFKAIQKNAR